MIYSLVYRDINASIVDVNIFWKGPLDLEVDVVFKSMPLVNYSIDVLSKSEFLCNIFKKEIEKLDNLSDYLWNVFKVENVCQSFFNEKYEQLFNKYVSDLMTEINNNLPELKIVEIES